MIMNMSANQLISDSSQIGAFITNKDNADKDNKQASSITNVSITGAIVPVNTAKAFQTMGDAIPDLTSNQKLHNIGPEIYTVLAQKCGGSLQLISADAKDITAPVQTGLGSPGSRSI